MSYLHYIVLGQFLICSLLLGTSWLTISVLECGHPRFCKEQFLVHFSSSFVLEDYGRGCEGRVHILFSVGLENKLIECICQFTDLLVICKLSASEQVIGMIWLLFDVLLPLFTIEHLPALYTEYLSITFRFYFNQFLNKGLPLWRISFYHFIVFYKKDYIIRITCCSLSKI